MGLELVWNEYLLNEINIGGLLIDQDKYSKIWMDDGCLTLILIVLELI